MPIYLVNVKTIRMIFQIVVAFSEKLNFNRDHKIARSSKKILGNSRNTSISLINLQPLLKILNFKILYTKLLKHYNYCRPINSHARLYALAKTEIIYPKNVRAKVAMGFT